MQDLEGIFEGAFSASDIGAGEENSFDPIPKGEYEAMIQSAQIKTTSRGDGKYLEIVFRITSYGSGTRVVYENLNILNPSAKAQEIGRRELAQLCLAIGKPTLRDSSELVGSSLKVELGIEQREGYEPKNRVKKYKASMSAGATAPKLVTAAKPAAAAPAHAAPARRPWERASAPAAAPVNTATQTAPSDNDDLPF